MWYCLVAVVHQNEFVPVEATEKKQAYELFLVDIILKNHFDLCCISIQQKAKSSVSNPLTKTNIQICQTVIEMTVQPCSVVQRNWKGDTENLQPVKTVTVHHENEIWKVICIISGPRCWNEASKSSFLFFVCFLFFFNFSLLSFLFPVSPFSFCQWNEILYLPYSSEALQISVWLWWIALN